MAKLICSRCMEVHEVSGEKEDTGCGEKGIHDYNEYIHRYSDFDGFFTKSNVTLLTGATDKQ